MRSCPRAGSQTSTSLPGALFLVPTSPESAPWPLPRAQRATELLGPQAPAGRPDAPLPALVTPSWGVRDSSLGEGLRPCPILPSLLTPPPPQPHPLGSWAEPGSDPGQVAWPPVSGVPLLSHGDTTVTTGSQASSVMVIGQTMLLSLSPGPPGSGNCWSSWQAGWVQGCGG